MKQTLIDSVARTSAKPGSLQSTVRERWTPVRPPDTVAKRIATIADWLILPWKRALQSSSRNVSRFLRQDFDVFLFLLAEPESSHLVHFALNNHLKWCNKRTWDVQWGLIIADWDFRVWWACLPAPTASCSCLLFVWCFWRGREGRAFEGASDSPPCWRKGKRKHYLFFDVVLGNKGMITCTLGVLGFFF